MDEVGVAEGVASNFIANQAAAGIKRNDGWAVVIALALTVGAGFMFAKGFNAKFGKAPDKNEEEAK